MQTTGVERQDCSDPVGQTPWAESWGEAGCEGLEIGRARRVLFGPGNGLLDLVLDLRVRQPALTIRDKLTQLDDPDPRFELVD